jgi:hypothetical protein
LRNRIRNALVIVAGSLLCASASLAGISNVRLDGVFLFEDDEHGDANEACLIAAGQLFSIDGQVVGAAAASCNVLFRYDTDLPSKVSGTTLKDGNGSAKLSQQVQTTIQLEVVGLGCTEEFSSPVAFPEKCKLSGSVEADEPSDAVDKAKVSLTCELGEGLSEIGTPSQTVLDEVSAAFAERTDVKLDDNGKLTIKTNGVPNSGDHSCT